MKIDSIKDLKAVIALCRKTGVSTIEIDGVKLHLGAEPIKKTVNFSSLNSQLPDYSGDFPESQLQVPQFQGYESPVLPPTEPKIDSDELTEEQLMFYSSASTDESVQ